jgi:hypothetical protein
MGLPTVRDTCFLDSAMSQQPDTVEDPRHATRCRLDAGKQDPQHDRDAWVHYKIGDYAPTLLQIDNDAILPYYSWLAKQFTYCDYHLPQGL